jgi:hypothetical protein
LNSTRRERREILKKSGCFCEDLLEDEVRRAYKNLFEKNELKLRMKDSSKLIT